MDLKKNIKKYRLAKKMTLDELAEKIGIKKSTLQRYESGVITNIPSDKIEKMAEVFGIKPSILMGWELEEDHLIQPALTIHHHSSLTVYGKVCAGDGFEAFEDPIDEIGDPYYRIKQEKFALLVDGDSMNRIVNNGMYAIIEKKETVNNGEIAVVLVDNEIGMLKRFYQLDESTVVLKPDSSNPEHKAMVFENEEINRLKILGRYLGHVSPMLDLLQ